MGESILLGILGLFLGRLLNVTIDRLPPGQASTSGKPGLSGRSPLLLVALAPIIGGFYSRGDPAPAMKVRLRYAAVEVITAGLAGFIGYQHGWTPAAVVLIVYCAVFIHLAFVDLEHSLILNKVVAPALPLSIVLFPFSPLGQTWSIPQAYLHSLAGSGTGFGIMLLVYIATRGGTGAGDVKLAALLGAALGFPQIVAALPLGFVIGGLTGAGLLALRLKGRKDAIPFGPALIAGAALVLLGGSGVYTWYLDLFP